MNFEEALKKVKAGTATAEERAFVEERISEAQSALTPKAASVDFDEALAHVQDGTATDEEREYVKNRLADATALLKSETPGENAEEHDIPEASAEEEQSSEDGEKSALEFEDALEHVQQGTATERETLYVKSQMAAANAFFSNDFRRSGAPVKEASGAEVKKAKKSFKMRYIVIPLSVVLIVILAIGAILGGVFGFAASSAHKNMTIGRDECILIAKNYVVDKQGSWFVGLSENAFTVDSLYVEDVERHFNYNAHDLSASYYSYEIEVKGRLRDGSRPGVEIEVKVAVNTKTKFAWADDYDIDWD